MNCPLCATYAHPSQRFCTGCGYDFLKQHDDGARSTAHYGWPETASYMTSAGASPVLVQPRRQSRWQGLGAGAFGLLALLSKLKGLLVLLKLGKFSGTLITMLISIAAYGTLFGLPFAIGIVLLLLVHEMGHWVVLRAKGVAAGAPVFIPFLGALIAMRGRPRNARDEAEIGIGGPIAGTAAALLTGIVGALVSPGSTQTFLYALGYVGLLLNLFNLIPVSPLDGGRVVSAISRWAWPVGLLVLVTLFVLHPSPILGLILLLGGFETASRFFGRDRARQAPGYYDVAPRERIILAIMFFGLLGVTFGGMELLNAQLQAIRDAAAIS